MGTYMLDNTPMADLKDLVNISGMTEPITKVISKMD